MSRLHSRSPKAPQPLVIDARRELRYPDGNLVVGWRDEDSAARGAIARPFLIGEELLNPRPSKRLTYDCNLPSPFGRRQSPQDSQPLPEALFDDQGMMKPVMEGEAATVFCASSLPGGGATIIGLDGRPARLRMRWLCVAADWSIGAVWRLFIARERAFRPAKWVWTGNDYLFDPADNAILWDERPASEGPEVEIEGQSLRLEHGPEGITHFACRLGVVKLRQARADGWALRAASHAELWPDGTVRVCFSDGAWTCLGHAASQEKDAAQRLAA